jgi:hypothetical protein
VKTFLLAATVAAGLLCTAGTADAQYRYRNGRNYSYTYPTYSYPTYSYATPTYYGSGVVTTSSYTPIISTDSGVVVTSGYPTSSVVYPSSYYPTYAPSYYNPGYYGGYNSGTYISPSSGVIINGRRAWRW